MHKCTKVRVINHKPNHAHVEPLLKGMNVMQIEDVYHCKVFVSLLKIREERCPRAIAEYCKFQNVDSRRWFQIQHGVKSNKIEKSPPKFHQIKSWNSTVKADRIWLLSLENDAKGSQALKKVFIDAYYEYCTQKKLFQLRKAKKSQGRSLTRERTCKPLTTKDLQGPSFELILWFLHNDTHLGFFFWEYQNGKGTYAIQA